jgi:phosphatidylinositol alpha-1,6-mannosyltransferase
MKKILVVTSELPPHPGGIGEYSHQLASSVSKDCLVKVLSFSHDNVDVDVDSFHLKSSYLHTNIPRTRFLALNICVRFLYVIKEWLIFRPDIIIPTGLRASFYCFIFSYFNTPIWFVGHGSEFLKRKVIKSIILKRARKIIVNGSYTLSLMEDSYPEFMEKAKIITIGGDENRFDRYNKVDDLSLLRAKYSISENDYVLLTVGRIDDRKAQDLVVDYLNVYRNIGIKYLIVGLEKDNGNVRRLIKEYKLDGVVVLCGFVGDEDMQAHYQLADVYIQPSRHSKEMDQVEGFGIAICEANLCGIPAIGTLNSGTRDAICSGINGLLINENSIEDLSESIIAIRQSPEYSEKAYHYATQHLTWKQFRFNIREQILCSLSI